MGCKGIELHAENESGALAATCEPAHEGEEVAEAIAANRHETPCHSEADRGRGRVRSGRVRAVTGSDRKRLGQNFGDRLPANCIS